MGQGSGGWLLTIVISMLMSLVMGLSLVWINIDRMNVTYRLRALEADRESRVNLKAKLEVERDRLLSPYELGRKAAAYGMKDARPGQIRRIEEAGR